MSQQTFDDRDGFIWVNGKMVPWRDANVHILTHAMHYAGAVFEGERMYEGQIFEMRAHNQRLLESARLLGYEIPYTVAQIDDACMQIASANNIVNGYFRPIAWRGSEMMGVSAAKNKVHLAIAAWEWPAYFPREALMRGLRLMISPWQRPSPKTAPVASKASGLYMICTMSKQVAENAKYDDCMMLDYRGYVAEATGANLFFVIDGALHTPTADCFLDGITRQTVMRLAKNQGIEVIERHIKPEEIKNASEAFMCGTAIEVVPIAEIGDDKFTPGEICATLIDGYQAQVRAHSQKSKAS